MKGPSVWTSSKSKAPVPKVEEAKPNSAFLQVRARFPSMDRFERAGQNQSSKSSQQVLDVITRRAVSREAAEKLAQSPNCPRLYGSRLTLDSILKLRELEVKHQITTVDETRFDEKSATIAEAWAAFRSNPDCEEEQLARYDGLPESAQGKAGIGDLAVEATGLLREHGPLADEHPEATLLAQRVVATILERQGELLSYLQERPEFVRAKGLVRDVVFGAPATGKSTQIRELASRPESIGGLESVSIHGTVRAIDEAADAGVQPRITFLLSPFKETVKKSVERSLETCRSVPIMQIAMASVENIQGIQGLVTHLEELSVGAQLRVVGDYGAKVCSFRLIPNEDSKKVQILEFVAKLDPEAAMVRGDVNAAESLVLDRYNMGVDIALDTIERHLRGGTKVHPDLLLQIYREIRQHGDLYGSQDPSEQVHCADPRAGQALLLYRAALARAGDSA